MSPVLRDVDGRLLWGNQDVAPDVVVSYGLAGWVREPMELETPPLKERVGANPLWLKAVAVQGSAGNEVVLSQADAEQLLQANEQSKFLERLAVVFIY